MKTPGRVSRLSTLEHGHLHRCEQDHKSTVINIAIVTAIIPISTALRRVLS